MSADVIAITVYLAVCHKCAWEGTDTTIEAEAVDEAGRHNSAVH